MINALMIKILIVAGLCIAAFTTGYVVENTKFSAYKNQQAGIISVLKNEAKMIEAKDKENANVAKQNANQAVANITDWYNKHPVIRVRVIHTSNNTVPAAASYSQIVDATAADQYVSPYSPAECEVVASRLDELQTLLRSDGVTIK